jgi:hypothetical protein
MGTLLEADLTPPAPLSLPRPMRPRTAFGCRERGEENGESARDERAKGAGCSFSSLLPSPLYLPLPPRQSFANLRKSGLGEGGLGG